MASRFCASGSRYRDWTHPKEIEGHVFHLALGYSLSYLPYALLVATVGVASRGSSQLVAVIFVVGAAVAPCYPRHRRAARRRLVEQCS